MLQTRITLVFLLLELYPFVLFDIDFASALNGIPFLIISILLRKVQE